MSVGEMPLIDILHGFEASILILACFAVVLYIVNYIINWVWWKKENRRDLYEFRYYLKNKEKIKEWINEGDKS